MIPIHAANNVSERLKRKRKRSRTERALQSVLMRLRPAILASVLKRIMRSERTVVETPRGKFWIDAFSNFGCAITHVGEYQTGMIDVLEKRLAQGSIFVDLGANEGYFTTLEDWSGGLDG